MKKTVVLGATPRQDRYAYLAATRLMRHGHEVVLVGMHEGKIGGVEIHTDRPHIEGVDTITLYVGTRNLPAWFDYILSLKPKRIIYNPGTENDELEKLAEENGIENEIGCTLVMLSVGNY